MPALFISYSRRDQSFVQRLCDALRARDYDVWVDWAEVSPGATWFEEVRRGIGGADGFVQVVSPDSMTSEICRQELEDATSLCKPIVPVVHRDPDWAAVPEELTSRKWVFMRDSDDFSDGVEELVCAIEANR